MFAIIVKGRSGREIELCRVGTNPKAIARAARRKYPKVTIKKIQQEKAPSKC
jgi:hypothetical protein